MKFKSKFTDWLLLLVTAGAIILSIVLWIFIMTNDQRFSQINQADSSSKQQLKTRSTKSLYDLCIPTNSYGYRNGQLYRLYDSKNNLSFEFSKDLQKLKVTSIKLISSSQSQYEKMLANQDYLQLTYPDKITFSVFATGTSKKDNRQLNRIFISTTGNNREIYIGNDKNYRIYRVKIKKGDFTRLRKYAQNAQYKTPIKFVKTKLGYTVYYTKTEKWRVYSYLTNKQADSYFVARLLGTSGVSTRTSKKGWTAYSLNYSTRLRVPKSKSNSDDYLYTHYEKNQYVTNTSRLLDSIYYVHLIGLTEQDLRFFDADASSIRYTNYVEGTPVFLNKHDVQVTTTFSTDSISVAFNSINLQIPIPFDGQTTTLAPTSEVVAKLKANGLDKSEIDDIVVGSQVQKDSTRDNLVNLVPTYYVKAYGEWKSVDEWMKQDLTAYRRTINSQESEAN